MIGEVGLILCIRILVVLGIIFSILIFMLFMVNFDSCILNKKKLCNLKIFMGVLVCKGSFRMWVNKCGMCFSFVRLRLGVVIVLLWGSLMVDFLEVSGNVLSMFVVVIVEVYVF